MNDKTTTEENKIRIQLRIINGNEYVVEVPPKMTIDKFIIAITNHFKLNNDCWGLILKSDDGNKHLCGDEYLETFLRDAKNAYLILVPQAVGG